MKLKRIELENYRNHAHSVLELDGCSFVVVRGPNHAGKSTIRESISMSLALTTPTLDAQGRNFQRKIKRGADKSVIKLDIQGGKHLIQQMVKLDTNTSGRTSRSVCLDDPDWKPLPFENFLTRYKDAILVATNSDYFILHMGEKEQKALLAKLALPEHYDFPQDKMDAVMQVLGEGAIDFSGEPFAVIDKTHKKLYDERAILNRQVKEFVIPDALPAALGVDSFSLQKELDGARSDRQRIMAEKDAAVKAAGEVEVKRARLQGKIDGLREKCRELDQKKKEAAKRILPEEELKALQKVAAKKDELAALNESLKESSERIAILSAVRQRFEEIPNAGTTCPTCDQVIDRDKFSKLAAGAGADHDEARKREKEIKTKIAALNGVEAAIASIEDHETAVTEKQVAEKALSEKIQEGKDTIEEQKALGAATDAAASFTQPLEKIDAKINEIVEQLRPVIAAEERKKEIAVRTEAKKKLEEKAASADSLVDYFGKDGIKAQLLADHVGGFENKINETLSAFGYKCSLSIEPWSMDLTNAEGDTCPITELSDSEQLMFSVAFQAAVARAAGIGFIVADRMDTFDPAERQKANKTLYKMAVDGVLEQVILVMTDASTDVPKLANSKFFFVERGTVRELKA